MKRSILTLVVLGSGLLTAQAQGQQQFPASLAGHALLPAKAFIAPPQDAPVSLRVSGKYTAADGRREERLETIPGTSYLSDRIAPRPTDVSLPLKGQPVQGFKGIKSMPDGTFWVLSDNGYGSEANSLDAMLMFLRG